MRARTSIAQDKRNAQSGMKLQILQNFVDKSTKDETRVFERRNFMFGFGAAIAGISLTGCERVKRFFQPEVPSSAIDIHTHIFNGRDVPAVGFLKQVILRETHASVDADITSDAFLKLLKTVLLMNTPTAKAELDQIDNKFKRLARNEAMAQDESNVAEAIARFSREGGGQTTGLSTTRNAETRILDRIANEVNAADIRRSLQTPEAQGRALSARIFKRDTTAIVGPGKEREYVHRSPFLQTIRWAGMLTRARVDILAELDRLYGGPGLIRVFSPSLVDFQKWFLTHEDTSPVEDQIKLLAAIARQNTTSLILPFAPFCPLRAALEREDTPDVDPLRIIKTAVLELGFVGVKLYPPMGFRPIGNRVDLTWVPRKPLGGGSALDRELEALYLWCVENEVPIKAHANNSIAAGPNTGAFADPAGWRELMQDSRFSSLQLNLAHFGGFDETASHGSFTSQNDWEETLGEMVDTFPNLYFDLGYWTEAGTADDRGRSRVIERTKKLLARSPKMVERMMYGSDWSMIGREPNHPAYLADVQATLIDLKLNDEQRQQVMGGNAATYLGLDRDGLQKQRVAAVYAANPIFSESFI